MMIKNIILDIGNVLVDFRYHALMLDLKLSEQAINVIEEKCVKNELWNQLDLGIIPEQQILNEMLGEVGEYKEDCQIFFDNLIDIVATYPYTISWIEKMKSQGLKVYLLSNYPKSLFELHDKERFGFTHLTDGRVVSAFVKMSKPDKRIYRYLLDTYELKADECLFFDDREENVEAARSIGINAHVFTTYQDALLHMKEYNLNI